MIQEPPPWIHLNSLLHYLNQKLFKNVTRGVYDFQTVPNCISMYKVLTSTMISHLQQSKENKVIIVNTFNSFPLFLLQKHESFDPYWLENQVSVYDIDTISKLTIFLQRQLKQTLPNTILIINNFHDLLDHYKMELSSCYQDILLKTHAINNATTIRQSDRQQVEGIGPDIVEIPRSSSLLRESPMVKFNLHVNFLFNLMSQLSYNNNLLIFLSGNLDIKFRPYALGSQDLSSSSFQIVQNDSTYLKQQINGSKGRLVLTMSDNYLSGLNSRSGSNIPESILIVRVMFYKDWYHKSPFYKQKVMKKDKLRQIYCMKIDQEVTYFDFEDGGATDHIFKTVDYSLRPFTENILDELSTDRPIEVPRPLYPPSSPNLTSDQSMPPPSEISQPLITISQARPQAQSTSQFVRPDSRSTQLERESLERSDVEDSLIIEDSQDMGIPLHKLRPEFF